jgi:hypothetical protein
MCLPLSYWLLAIVGVLPQPALIPEPPLDDALDVLEALLLDDALELLEVLEALLLDDAPELWEPPLLEELPTLLLVVSTPLPAVPPWPPAPFVLPIGGELVPQPMTARTTIPTHVDV